MAVSTPSTAPTGGRVPAAVLFVAVVLYPVAWVAGLASLVWFAMAAPMILALVRRPRLLVPPYFGAWTVFVVLMGASVVRVDDAGSLAVWGLRAGWYLSATLLLLYLINQPHDDRYTTRSIVRSLFALWLIAIGGGWAAIVAPQVAWSGPAGRLIPGAIRSNDFVADLTNPAFAEVQRVGGELLGRPAAPFAYTNSWGSTVAILLPFAVLAAVDARMRIPRALAVASLLAAVPPLAVSLNRGSWLTIGLGLLFAGASSFRRGGRRGVVAAVFATIAIAVVATVTGITGSIVGQLDARTADSNETRTSLYREAIVETVHSPILGYGSPRPSVSLPDGPPIGTHGQLWMVMFSHGYVAAFAYVGFFVAWLLRADTSTPVALWTRTALLIVCLQFPIYGQLPQQLLVAMAAVAIMHLHQRATAVSRPATHTDDRHLAATH